MATSLQSRSRRWLCVVVAVVVGVATATVCAGQASNRFDGWTARALGAITPGTGWQVFNWNVGSLPNPSTNNPITFTLSGAGYVAITDFLYDGDQFAVYDGSTFLGNTSTPLNDGQFVVNFDAAWANPAFSKAIFPLAAGSHSINVFVIRNAVCSVCNGSGSGLIRAGLNNDGFYSPPIPTLGLIGLAGLALLLGVVGFVLLRRG